MHYYFSLFVLFSVGALVLAAPAGEGAGSVNKEDLKKGDVYWSRLQYLKPGTFHRVCIFGKKIKHRDHELMQQNMK